MKTVPNPVFAIQFRSLTTPVPILVFLVAVVSLAFFYLSHQTNSQVGLDASYKTSFNGVPPVGVKVINASQTFLFDSAIWNSGWQYLEIKMTPAEIERHLRMGFEKLADPPSAFKNYSGAKGPEWLKLPLPDGTEFYHENSWTPNGDRFGSYAVMAVNRETDTVWFYFEKTGSIQF